MTPPQIYFISAKMSPPQVGFEVGDSGYSMLSVSISMTDTDTIGQAREAWHEAWVALAKLAGGRRVYDIGIAGPFIEREI